jgi:hypothetical protein
MVGELQPVTPVLVVTIEQQTSHPLFTLTIHGSNP